MQKVLQEQVKLVALRPLPYQKIQMPLDQGGAPFTATKGYSDFFISKGLARLATDDDGPLVLTTRDMKAQPKKKNGKPVKGQYKRRDLQAE